MIPPSKRHYILWAVFAAYVVLLIMALAQHELWGDEIHSWNIARSSNGLFELLRNSRYEGHPPLWYVVLFTLTRFTHEPEYLKPVQGLFAMGMVYMVMFRSPFPLLIRSLIPFGYYFAFEYAALSRNYAIALLLGFWIAWLLVEHPQRKYGWFCALIFLLSNTHLLGLLLALSFCVYRAWQDRAAHGSYRYAFWHLFIGGMLCLPAALQIAPPGDSQLNFQFWIDHWTAKQWDTIAQAPLKAIVPIPDHEQFGFWNSNALMQHLLAFTNGLVIIRCCAVALIIALGLFLRKDRGSLVFFLTNLVLTIAVAFLFPLTSARYVGFIWVGFLIACWLYLRERSFGRVQRIALYAMLFLQVIASPIALWRDRVYPFSNSAKVRELYRLVPADATVVTDYWCLNNLSAFLERSFYCLEHRQELSFLRWDKELAEATKRPNFYTTGLNELCEQRGLNDVYMISVNDPDRMRAVDSGLAERYDLTLVDRFEGSIEAHSNVYLYRIVRRSPSL